MATLNFWKTIIGVGLTTMMASGPALAQANLRVSEFSLTPSTPVQGQPVQVRVRVHNSGNDSVGPFTVKWWPGENYPAAACTWNLPHLRAQLNQVLTCTYAGYPSWYGSIKTRVLLDTTNAWPESNEADNDYRVQISVKKPAPVPVPKPNLFISEMSLNPPVPVQGQPVQVRIGVYNNGDTTAGPSRVHWWPGENYSSPGCGWNVGPLVKNGGRILTCTYSGYPSWYGSIRTKATADVLGAVNEKNEGDNTRLMKIQVAKP
jgi:hypothetical protein